MKDGSAVARNRVSDKLGESQSWETLTDVLLTDLQSKEHNK